MSRQPTDPEFRPERLFHVGNRVAVQPSERLDGGWVGTVRHIVWHFRHNRWMYYLHDDAGIAVERRFWADDLKRVDV